MPHKHTHEGYLLVDHRDSPGIRAEDITPQLKARGFAPTEKLFESATISCAICNCIVVLNPNRSRPRHYHPETDRYICDSCAELRAKNFVACADQAFDYVQEQVFRKEEGYNPLPKLSKISPLLSPVPVKF